MLTFVVSGPEALFSEFVAALIRSTRPDAIVNIERSREGEAVGVKVRVAETGRWLFVSTAIGADTTAARALDDGACAVLSVGSQASDFRLALDAVVTEGASYVPMEIMRRMAHASLSPDAGGAPDPVHNLTAREREILDLVSLGCSNKEMARILTISTNTVRTHLRALYVKFNAHSRTRMLAAARAAGVPEARFGESYDRRSA